MANMGTNGEINITKGMMDAAITAIDNYQNAVNGLNSELASEISSLIPSSFSGSAAQGFKTFYEVNIEKNAGENLTKMLDALKSVCETVKSQIPGDEQGVDDQLGSGNSGTAGAEA